ncbi:MAG: ATP-binding protein, partial [Amphritea sp.]|nr:ATP-binding protein [Amphritea sp.]
KWVEDISHELKTPLTLISGEIEAVRDGIREVTPATLELLSQDVARLNHLVDDLKALWQSEPGAIQLERESCQLHQLLSQSVDKFRGQLVEQQISLNVQLPDTSPIQADQHRMAQVFDNILSNTLRYTDKPGSLSVTLSSEADLYRLVFSDSGPGVPYTDLPRLFDRLYRVERSRNRALGGVGIGLAICRNIVQAHGGIISASQSEQGGLSLTIELPAQAQE